MFSITQKAQGQTYIEDPEQSKKLNKYSEKKPYTHLFPCNKRKRTLRTIENKEIDVSKPMGPCWAGSYLKANACLEIRSIEHRNAKLAAAADAYLLARRQTNINAALCVGKAAGATVLSLAIGITLIATPAGVVCLAAGGITLPAIAAGPLEGTVDAYQTKKIMKKILTDNGINTKRHLKKIDFFKMSLQSKSSVNTTPMRNGCSTSALPRNTKKTREHLRQVFAGNQSKLNKLERIILSSDSYYNGVRGGTTEGLGFKEEGWRHLLKSCVIEPDAGTADNSTSGDI